MSFIEYRPGAPISDSRYEGNRVLYKKGSGWPYSPYIEWEPPVYHPFTKKDLVAVHLTDQDARSDYILKPGSHTPFIFKSIRGKDEWLLPRETVHFTLNGVPDDHRGGQSQEEAYSWSKKRFAYLIPFQELYDQTISVFTHDTIVLGQVKLPKNTVIVENQDRDKVLDTVSKLGFQPLDLQGVKELDPAYLLGTTTNVNHPINFASMIKPGIVDGPYTDTSDNNILVLDAYLTSVLQVLGPRNYAISISQDVVDEIKRRMSFFVDRYIDDPNRGPGVTRLQKIVDLYIHAMREDMSNQELNKQPYVNNTSEEYTARMERARTRELEIGSILQWNNAQYAIQKQ